MPRIGLPELIVILIAILLIFGPKNLPKLGAALGKTVKNVRDGMDGKMADAESVEEDDSEKDEKESNVTKVSDEKSKE